MFFSREYAGNFCFVENKVIKLLENNIVENLGNLSNLRRID